MAEGDTPPVVKYIVRPAREPRERTENINAGALFNSLLIPGLLVGGGIIAYVYKDQLTKLLNNGSQLIQDIAKNPTNISELISKLTGALKKDDNPVGGQPAPSTGTSTGPVSSTGQWYKANGPTAAMPNARCSSGKCGTSTGGNSGGNRWENEVKGFMDTGFEVVVYFQIPSGGMCKGGHIGLKHGGPNHTSPCEYSTGGACCCWWDTGIDNDQGKAYVEIERPHPNNMNRKYFASVGTKLDSGKPIGVRWHISKEGSGIRLMQWIDTSGKAGAFQWKETYNVLDTGQFMPADYFKNHITNLQNIEIRISDVVCKDIKMLVGPISRKITSASANVGRLSRELGIGPRNVIPRMTIS